MPPAGAAGVTGAGAVRASITGAVAVRLAVAGSAGAVRLRVHPAALPTKDSMPLTAGEPAPAKDGVLELELLPAELTVVRFPDRRIRE